MTSSIVRIGLVWFALAVLGALACAQVVASNPAIPARDRVCRVDDDCVLLPDACPCVVAGAVSRGAEQDALASLGPKPTQCPGIVCNDDRAAACLDGRCELVAK